MLRRPSDQYPFVSGHVLTRSLKASAPSSVPPADPAASSALSDINEPELRRPANVMSVDSSAASFKDNIIHGYTQDTWLI